MSIKKNKAKQNLGNFENLNLIKDQRWLHLL